MMFDHPKSPFLTSQEAADYLRLDVKTLNNMRWRGEGPNYRKHGGKVVYHQTDLEYWSTGRDAGDHRVPPKEETDT
jgi:hypothetical protein